MAVRLQVEVLQVVVAILLEVVKAVLFLLMVAPLQCQVEQSVEMVFKIQ